jgi:hypothetical protein
MELENKAKLCRKCQKATEKNLEIGGNGGKMTENGRKNGRTTGRKKGGMKRPFL